VSFIQVRWQLQKEWYVVRGADHNDVPSVGGRAYFAKLFAFIHAAIGR